MHGDGEAVDVEGHPDLEELAEEVCTSGRPRSLRRKGEEVARIVPVRGAPLRGEAMTDDQWVRLMAMAGAWADVDAEAFVREVYAAREAGTRPLPES